MRSLQKGRLALQPKQDSPALTPIYEMSSGIRAVLFLYYNSNKPSGRARMDKTCTENFLTAQVQKNMEKRQR